MAIKIEYKKENDYDERVVLKMSYGDFLGLHGSANKLLLILEQLDHLTANPDADEDGYVHWAIRQAHQMNTLLAKLNSRNE